MIQTLDLARENAVLKDEVDRLRRTVAQLANIGGVSPTGTRSNEVNLQRATSSDADARVVLVMPSYVAWEHELLAERLAGVPRCEVIVDRRVMERRRGQAGSPVPERRRCERRAGERDASPALVVSVVAVEVGRER
jgi:hypothetical protein